jgi:hypothetical protein
MRDDFLKLLGLIIVAAYFVYLAVRSMKLQSSIMEGLTNPPASTDNALTQNKASGAQAYADEIQKIYAKITDNLLIKDNRTAYENVIIQMDDFITALMLQKIMSIDKTSLTEDNLVDVIGKINVLNQGKQSLNSVMKFVDGM